MNFAGFAVIVQPDVARLVPNMKLSARVREVLSPEYAEDTEKWMIEFFGTRVVLDNVIPDDSYILVYNERKILMNPRMYRRFVEAVIADNFKAE